MQNLPKGWYRPLWETFCRCYFLLKKTAYKVLQLISSKLKNINFSNKKVTFKRKQGKNNNKN